MIDTINSSNSFGWVENGTYYHQGTRKYLTTGYIEISVKCINRAENMGAKSVVVKGGNSVDIFQTSINTIKTCGKKNNHRNIQQYNLHLENWTVLV